jgi:putative transposase
MKKSRFSDSQRASIVAEHKNGKRTEDLCREHGISAATLYKWQKEIESFEDDSKRQLAQMEAENKRLKQMYADLSLRHEILAL